MVISAIKKKLGKGPEDTQQDAPSEDVPEDLPPLMEDDQDVPDELPEVDNDSPDNIEEAQPPADESAALSEKKQEEEAPDASEAKDSSENSTDSSGSPSEKKTKTPDQSNTTVEQKTEEPKKEAQQSESTKTSQPDSSQQRLQESKAPSGFFDTLRSIVDTQPNLQDDLLGQDLLSRMKAFWSAKHTQEQMSWDNEKLLGEQLQAKMKTLQSLESKWHIQALALEHERELLQQREEEIKQKSAEVQLLLRAMKFYKRVSHEEAFHLVNGMTVHSLKELFDTVSVLDESTLYVHVHGQKNDFANWVDHVLGFPDIARSLRGVRTRGGLLKVLEASMTMKTKDTEPGAFGQDHKKYHTSPDKYFKTVDGSRIESLHDLAEKIRGMDSHVFDYHVNPQRNDFADWVQHVFHLKDLAKRMKLARTQSELVNILDVYI